MLVSGKLVKTFLALFAVLTTLFGAGLLALCGAADGVVADCVAGLLVVELGLSL